MYIRYNLIRKTPIVLLFLLPVLTAIGQPTPAEKETVLGIINFDNEGGFPTYNHGDTAIAKAENGQYVMDVRKSNREWTLHFGALNLATKPDIMEIKLKIEADDIMASYRNGWNTVKTGPNRFDDYFILIEGPSMRIVKSENGKDVPLSGPGWLYSTAIHSRDFNVVRIEQSTDSLHRFYVNGELMFELKLPPTNLKSLALWVDPHAALYVDYYKLAIKK